MSELCVFTAGQDLALARASCERVGIRLQEFDGKWSTFSEIKLVRARKFLETRGEKFAMWIDGHDSLLLQDEETILRRYHAIGRPVVVSAERSCHPDPERAESYPVAPTGWPRFLNAGGWIGRTEDLISVLDRVRRADPVDHDQRAWTTALLAGILPEVTLDYARRIFACVGDGPGIMSADTCVMHWNGGVAGRDRYWKALQAC